MVILSVLSFLFLLIVTGKNDGFGGKRWVDSHNYAYV